MRTTKLSSSLKNIVLGLIVLSFLGCNTKNKKESNMKANEVESVVVEKTPNFKMSLAQWSLNKSVRVQGVSPFNFAKEANLLGILNIIVIFATAM